MNKTTKIILSQIAFTIAIVIIHAITEQSFKDLFEYYLGLSIGSFVVVFFDK